MSSWRSVHGEDGDFYWIEKREQKTKPFTCGSILLKNINQIYSTTPNDIMKYPCKVTLFERKTKDAMTDL
jgi:hypothetical protein